MCCHLYKERRYAGHQGDHAHHTIARVAVLWCPENHVNCVQWQEAQVAARVSGLSLCPRDCFDTCGIAVVKRKGVVAHLRGDSHHPVSRGKLCAKGSISRHREWRTRQARLTTLLRRVGPKREGRFEPISWDTTLTVMAERFKKIVTPLGRP